MLTKFHRNWSIPDIDCKQFKKVTFPRKNKAKDLSGMIKQILFFQRKVRVFFGHSGKGNCNGYEQN